MTDETCSGYSNYETFTIAAEFDNDYSLYQAKMNFIKGPSPLTSETVKAFCVHWFPNKATHPKVNWDELALDFQSERIETLENVNGNRPSD